MKPARATNTRRLPRILRRWCIALGRMEWWKFAALLFVLSFAARLVAVLLVGFTMDTDDMEQPGRAERAGLLVAVILAPLAETLVIQAFATWGIRRLLPGSFLLPVIVSGVLFGCGHTTSLLYATAAFFIGLAWAFAYLSRLAGRGFASAFWLVATVHALNNITAFIL